MAILVLTVLAAIVAGTPTVLRATGAWTDSGAPTIAETVFVPPTNPAEMSNTEGVAGMASGVSARHHLDSTVLKAAVDAIAPEGIGTHAWMVARPDGTVLAEHSANTPLIPASTMKLLTGLLVTETLPSSQRFATRVLNPQPGTLVLVGGGDPYLVSEPVAAGYPRPASLTELAQATAAALKTEGQTSVQLGFDASLFVGPDWEPTWEKVFETDVTRVVALTTDGGVDPTSKTRTATPAQAAAARFAALLSNEGITVTGPVTPASGSGRELAKVESLPVHTLVQEALQRSDNTATEVLLRHAAIKAGREASFAGGAETLRHYLTSNKIWDTGAIVHDGSGISRTNRVTSAMLSKAVSLVLSRDNYRGLLDSFPVAGVTGTLHNRFEHPTTAAGRGWVRAKTGSLRDVSSLAGYARTADDESVIVVFMANGVTSLPAARLWMDRAASVVAGCGCR